jgi:hypothetical protein
VVTNKLSRQAITRHPGADGLYIGGSWLSETVCQALEREIRPASHLHQSCMIEDTLTRLSAWKRSWAGAPFECGLSHTEHIG